MIEDNLLAHAAHTTHTHTRTLVLDDEKAPCGKAENDLNTRECGDMM